MRKRIDKSKNKKIAAAVVTALVVIASAAAYMVFFGGGDGFYVDGKKKTEMTKNVEFGETPDISPKALKLTAKKDGKKLEISYEEPQISKLKTYEVKYKAKGLSKEFILKLDVKDTTAPVITGTKEYTVGVGEEFTKDKLDVLITDNYDDNLTDKLEMNQVVTSKEGTYDSELQVKDSSGNVGKMKIKVTVSESAGGSDSPSGIRPVPNPDDVTVLLNKGRALPDGWAPADLVGINSNNGGEQYLRSEAAAQWEKIRTDSLNDGLVINVVSSYRSQSYQENLYNYYMSFDPINAPYYSACPRTSEHEAGLAIDISYDGSLHDDLQNSSVGAWMNENGWKYGWIMRYPKGKEHITGYIFEPWHYRYVGKDLAEKLHNRGITMEEYYG